MASWNYETCIGDLFLEKLSLLFPVYQQYFSHLNIITENYQQLLSTKNFQKFMKVIELNTGMEVVKMLKIPMKKLDEYRTSITELKDATNEDHPDKTNLDKLSLRLLNITQNIQQNKVLDITLDKKTTELFSKMNLTRMDIGKVIQYPHNPEMNEKIIQIFLFKNAISWCFCLRGSDKFTLDYISPLNFVWISDWSQNQQFGRQKKMKSKSMIITKLSQFVIKTPDRFIELEIPNKQEFISDFYNNLCEEFSMRMEDILQDKERVFTYPYRNLTKHTGAFIKATPTGRSKVEYPNGTIFEGEYVDGKKEGKGIIKFSIGDVLVSFWKNGLPNGDTVLTDPSGKKYQGMFVDGKREGEGEFIDIDGTIYQGEFKNNMFHGDGTIEFSDGTKFIGTFQFNSREGFGKFIENENCYYEGNWENDMRNGFGKQVFNNGEIYEGQWMNDMKHGKGKLISNQEYYDGNWEYNCKNGKGLMVWKDTKWYDGEWKNSLRHGNGIYVNGNYKYTGSWENNLPNGKGELTYYARPLQNNFSQNDLILDEKEPEVIEKIIGNFTNGKPNHQVKYYFPKRYRFEGEMNMGKKNGEGTLFFDNGGKATLYWNQEIPNYEKSTKMEFISKTGLFRLNYDPSGAVSEHVTIRKEENNTIFERQRDDTVQRISEHFDQWLIPHHLSFINQCNWF
ncbi:hypothetical protein M0811_07960 [Anaeramoeba ignava]|uniref:DH domain-containing protein n=1 Tax=Anaeramoeba ignava TaxID=1746090 RepID=A0A9Q0LLA2_ANAIG|nr:hypothetical protein M0811_07960 [Anaeramoeba ignava]